MGLKSQSPHYGFERSASEGKSSSHQEVKPRKGKVLSEGNETEQEKWQGQLRAEKGKPQKSKVPQSWPGQTGEIVMWTKNDIIRVFK